MQKNRTQDFRVTELQHRLQAGHTGLGKLHELYQFLPKADEDVISVEISTYSNMRNTSEMRRPEKT